MSEIISFVLYIFFVILIIVSIGMLWTAFITKFKLRFRNKPCITRNDESDGINEIKVAYNFKKIMSVTEFAFYRKLLKLNNEYIIHPQISLYSIVNRTVINENIDLTYYKYANELNRIIDFAIFDKNYQNLILLIELDDDSHSQSNRIERDRKVNKIIGEIGVPLLRFYTKYPNEETYVINRIRQTIADKQIVNVSNEI